MSKELTPNAAIASKTTETFARKAERARVRNEARLAADSAQRENKRAIHAAVAYHGTPEWHAEQLELAAQRVENDRQLIDSGRVSLMEPTL